MRSLAQFDEAYGVVEMPGAASRLYNGFYTLTFPDGSHKTFRIFTKKATAKFAAGRRLIAMLIGPDNTEDYEPFGFVSDEGIEVWKRLRGPTQRPSKHEQYAVILWDLATGQELDGHELLVSRRCLICNRELTDPESITRGIGPTCWERM